MVLEASRQLHTVTFSGLTRFVVVRGWVSKRTALHRLAQIMGHDSLDTTMVYVKGTRGDLQNAVEEIAWA